MNKKYIMATGLLTAMTSMTGVQTAFANNETIENVVSANDMSRASVQGMNAIGKVSNMKSYSTLNVRKSNSLSSAIIGSLKYNATVTITGKTDNGWYKINYGGKVGYCSTKYINLSNQSTTSSTNINATGRVNLSNANLRVRKSSSVNSSIVGKLSPGQKVNVVSKKSNGWYYINSGKIKGYVDGKYIDLNSSSSTSNSTSNSTQSNKKSNKIGKIATVTASTLNVRKGPSTSYSVLSKIHSGANVKILDSNSNGWYKVELSSGLTGWCDGDYLSNFRTGTLTQGSTQQSTNQSNSNKVKAVISMAKAQLGKPYVWGATGPNSFDCSGFTAYVLKHGAGVTIPRVSYMQASAGKHVSKSNLQPGDLVFFDTMNKGRISHVGLYIGNGQMIHAPKPGDVVKVQNINNNYYNSKYVTARRCV